jgi:hypothetical protein
LQNAAERGTATLPIRNQNRLLAIALLYPLGV